VTVPGADVSLVIPTFNGRHLLGECLAAVEAQTRPPEQVVVVDNGSTDGTAAWVRERFPRAVVVRNERNRGFAAAVNRGITATTSGFVALLNNDAVADARWLERLCATAAVDGRVGAVASRMMFRDAPTVVSSAGIRMDRSGLAWDLWLGATSWPAEPVEVFGASGGACLLQEVGLFEEAFFAYTEDVDLAWRARLRGWRAVLAPDAVVYHALSATAVEGSPFKRYQLARNRWWSIARNYPWPALLVNLPIVLFYDLLPVANGLARGDTVPLRGRAAALAGLPRRVRERRRIQARRTASWAELRAAMSPVEAPWALYRRARLVARLAGRRTGGGAGR
jgi:GT2 family glycosyltransferase